MAIPFATISNVETIVKKAIDEYRKEVNAYVYMKQVRDFLGSVEYNAAKLDYDKANENYKHLKPIPSKHYDYGACTGVIDLDRKVAIRNHDWKYNLEVSFFIGTVGNPELEQRRGRATSVGVADRFSPLTKDVLDKGGYNESFQFLPFDITDGLNEYGIYIQENVVFGDPTTVDVNPGAPEECAVPMLCRYILDHLKDIDDLDEVMQRIHIYGVPIMGDFFTHYLVAQVKNGVVKYAHIECNPDGKDYIIFDGQTSKPRHGAQLPPILTNFRLTGADQFDSTTWHVIPSKVGTHENGIERWNLCADYLKTPLATRPSANQMMKDTFYTRTYTAYNETEQGYSKVPLWLTEYVKPGTELTTQEALNRTAENIGKFMPVVAETRERFEKRKRDDKSGTWLSKHSGIYDLEAHDVDIYIQERGDDAVHATPRARI